MADTNPRDGMRAAVDLVKAYVRQETVDPLRDVGRYLGFGLAGALCTGIGLLLLALGLLRVLQVETAPHFTGSWSWLPYVLTLLAVGLVLGLIARSMLKGAKRG